MAFKDLIKMIWEREKKINSWIMFWKEFIHFVTDKKHKLPPFYEKIQFLLKHLKHMKHLKHIKFQEHVKTYKISKTREASKIKSPLLVWIFTIVVAIKLSCHTINISTINFLFQILLSSKNLLPTFCKFYFSLK